MTDINQNVQQKSKKKKLMIITLVFVLAVLCIYVVANMFGTTTPNNNNEDDKENESDGTLTTLLGIVIIGIVFLVITRKYSDVKNRDIASILHMINNYWFANTGKTLDTDLGNITFEEVYENSVMVVHFISESRSFKIKAGRITGMDIVPMSKMLTDKDILTAREVANKQTAFNQMLANGLDMDEGLRSILYGNNANQHQSNITDTEARR